MATTKLLLTTLTFLMFAVYSATAAASSETMISPNEARQLASHFISRRLASGAGTVWYPTTYKCKMDMTQPFNRSDPTQPFRVKCSETYTPWPLLAIVGLVVALCVVPALVQWCKNQYAKCAEARETRRAQKQQRARDAALRHKAFLQA